MQFIRMYLKIRCITESLDKFVHMNRSFAKRIDGSIELHLNSNHDGEITKNVERADMGLFCSIGIIQRSDFFLSQSCLLSKYSVTDINLNFTLLQFLIGFSRIIVCTKVYFRLENREFV